MTTDTIPTPATIYAESEAAQALDGLQWVRAQGWMHGEFLALAELLADAYASGYAAALEFAAENCPLDDCPCTCH